MSDHTLNHPLPEPIDLDQFVVRLDRYLDGAMNEAELADFSDELLASDVKRLWFRELGQQHQMLRALGSGAANRQKLADLAAEDESAVSGIIPDEVYAAVIAEAWHRREVSEVRERAERMLAVDRLRLAEVGKAPAAPAPRGPRVVVIPHAAVYGAIAAMLLLGIWVVYAVNGGPEAAPPTAPPTAQVTPETLPAPVILATIRESIDSPPLAGTLAPDGRGLLRGEYVLATGLMRIELAGGAEVVLQGPARFMLESENAMRLIEGRIVAKVSPAAWGFTVDTPSARIVDLGTEFGVRTGSATGTEVHVFEGEVRAAPRAEDGSIAGAIPLRANQAAAIDSTRSLIRPIQFAGDQFERRVIKRLDLIDIVAGGKGTTHRRETGVNPATGGYVVRLNADLNFISLASDGAAHAVPSNPLLARVFIPTKDGSLAGLPAGLTLPGLPQTNGFGFGTIWCGRSLDTRGSRRVTEVDVIPEVLGNFTFNRPEQQTMLMHANAGLIFDLQAIRNAHPGYRIAGAYLIVGNSSGAVAAGDETDFKSEFLAYVDDRVAAHATFQRSLPLDQHATEMQFNIPADAAYLTLVSGDGGDKNNRDWLILGDPVLVLEPIDAPAGN